MNDPKVLKKTIDDLEVKLANSHKMLDIIWNNAIKAAMDQFGIEHKPRCTHTICASCVARENLKPLIRDGNMNRKTPREIIGEFFSLAEEGKKYIGKERKAYIQGVHDLFEELIRKGLV